MMMWVLYVIMIEALDTIGLDNLPHSLYLWLHAHISLYV